MKPRTSRRGPGANNNRRKLCHFCTDNIQHIDFTDAGKMKRYLSERGKILPRRITGTCAWHQRMLASRIKTSRQAALIPYVMTSA
jgi:small subunit ribosomal protein S18